MIQKLILCHAIFSDADAAFHALTVKAFDGNQAVAIAAPGRIQPFRFSDGKRAPQVARIDIPDPQRSLLPVQENFQLLRFPNLLKALGRKPAFHNFRPEGMYLSV